MATVTLEVSSRENSTDRFLRAFRGETQGSFISFSSAALLFKLLTQKRWDLLAALTGAGPVALREAARRVGRDVKAVKTDVHALLRAGVLEETSDGRIVFPYDSVRVSFELKAA